MLPDSKIQEGLSVAYIKAICNKAGHDLKFSENDNGVDITVSKLAIRSGNKVYPTGHNLDIQAKSTYNFTEEEDFIKYSIKTKNYNDLVQSGRGSPIIFVLLCMPREKERWLYQTEENLRISKCAYWCSLEGEEMAPSEESTKTIRIPKTNIFSETTMMRMMEDIKENGEINATY